MRIGALHSQPAYSDKASSGSRYIYCYTISLEAVNKPIKIHSLIVALELGWFMKTLRLAFERAVIFTI